MNNQKSPMRLLVAVAATLALASPALVHAAAVDYYLKLDGIEGESAAKGHEKEIEVLSFSLGASQASSAAGTRLSATRPCVSDVNFSKRLDKASPLLFANAATGMVIPKAKLTARRAGLGQQEFLVIELTNVLVSSYTAGASGEEASDQFALNFASMKMDYKPTNADGSLGAPVTATIKGGC